MPKTFCCDRCKAAPDKNEFSEDFNQESVAVVRLTEVNTNFGLLAVMCVDCRREWTSWLNKLKTMREYSETGFTLEHYRTAHKRTGTQPISDGINILRKLNDLDDRLFEEATRWIKAGPSKAERERRFHESEQHEEN